MHTIGFKAIQVVYKRLGCLEEGRVPYSIYVSIKPISKSSTLMKFNRNSKRLGWSYKKLKCIPLALWLYRWCIRRLGVSKEAMRLILTVFRLNLYKSITLMKLKDAEGVV